MIKKLQQTIGYNFKNPQLLKEALTHKSQKQKTNNERLEFLGDAVLDLIVGEHLFFELPKSKEGELSKLRASLVNEKSLSKLALSINLGAFLKISRAEEANKGRKKPSILANALEALIGAIYLDSSLENAKDFALNLLKKEYPVLELDIVFKDYKTTLQEITQEKFKEIPSYKVVQETGPDHNKEFEVEVFIGKVSWAKARGKSKKEAEQTSAKIVLEKLS